MKIYKFKDLREESKFPHLLQIIEENKIWCASPDSLNDPDEFRFDMECEPTHETKTLLTSMLEKLGTTHYPPKMIASHAIHHKTLQTFTKPEVDIIIKNCRGNCGVTSFSMTDTGEDLWKRYGGYGNGAVVEIEIPDNLIGDRYHIVSYEPVRTFHIDLFFKSQLTGSEEIFRKILCTKTTTWEDEQEIRYLSKTPNINIVLESPVTSLTIGNKVSTKKIEQLIAICEQKEVPIKMASTVAK